VRDIWTKGILVSVAALSLCGLAAGEALASQAYDRGDWMMGMSIGFGRGSWTDSMGERTTVTEGISPQWRVGKMLGSHWALGFEYNGWLIEDGDIDNRFRRSLQNFGLAATWYPGNPRNAWGGLWLRGGMSYALAGTSEVSGISDDDHEALNKVRVDEEGIGTVFGVGYEFWIAKNFTAGFASTVSYLSIGQDFVDEALYFIPLTMNIGLYW